MIALTVPKSTDAAVYYIPDTDTFELIISDGHIDDDLMTSLMKQLNFLHEGTFGSLYHDLVAIDRATTIPEQRGMANCVALLRAIADELREDYDP